jgi:serine protease inhibitor
MTHANRFLSTSLVFGTFLLFVLGGLLAVAPIASGQQTAKPTAPDPVVAIAVDPQVRKVVAANIDFGFALLEQLNAAAPGKNVFFSPFGVSTALTMVIGGAGGATAQDIDSSLGLGEMTGDQFDAANGLLLSSLNNPDPKVDLSVANALWGNLGTTFNSGFQDRSHRFYAAQISALDFNAPDASKTINAWAKTNTHGKIDSLVTPADLTASKAILANVVYFHGTWQHKFLKESTTPGPFTLEPGRTKTLPMMAQVESFPYLDTPDFQAVSLPYGAGRLSLLIFLPKSGSDLNTWVGGLTRDSWEEWIAKMQPTEMNLSLPRFKVSTEANLIPSLTALGMASVFSQGADFTPMGLHGSFLNSVVHKAVLEVDEDGTVAVAATRIGFAGGGGFAPKRTAMKVDHPFFCAIRDSATGTLLFEGVIRDPN